MEGGELNYGWEGYTTNCYGFSDLDTSVATGFGAFEFEMTTF